MTGLSTDACEQGCDEGAAEVCDGVPVFPPCCGGEGHCIDPGLVPDDLESSLGECNGDGEGLLCVPDEMQAPDYAGSSCQGNSLILGQYGGVCLPKCLKIFLEISFDKTPCPDEYMCVPCDDPLTGGSTGAPGCEI